MTNPHRQVRLLYSGDAALKLMTLPELRRAGPANVETLRVLLNNARIRAEREPGIHIAGEVREAAKLTSRLTRELNEIAKKIEGACGSQDDDVLCGRELAELDAIRQEHT